MSCFHFTFKDFDKYKNVLKIIANMYSPGVSSKIRAISCKK